MWPWKRGKKPLKLAAETLEERVMLVEAEFRSLKMEWINSYKALAKLAGRVDAGHRWDASKPPSSTTTEGEKAPENGSEAVPQPAPETEASPTPRSSRMELMRSLTR